MPEAQIRQTFIALETNVGPTLDSVFSVVVTGPGTVIHYDQWEDGYETDFNNPGQATTRIWGDGNDANGVPPGFTNDPAGLTAGTVISLRNLVPLPRNPANLLFDARDRIAATKALVISRAAWATTPGPVLSGAVEVPATIDYATVYVSPVGQDVTNRLFQYCALLVLASEDGTVVTLDPDGPGGAAPFNITLNRGESHLVNGGVRKGGTVTATKPVMVNLVVGRFGGRYATDWFTLYPVNDWSSSYYTPVGTPNNGNTTFVYLYNPNTNAITVNITTRAGSASTNVAANGGVAQFALPKASGARFTSAGGENFFALSTVAAAFGSESAYDWGFTLLPADGLTTEAVVGWGPGSGDGTVNGSPVWVTAPSSTRVYVDLNGDRAGPLTDPFGNNYDVHYDIAALESRKVYDPDRDQTAMRLYTADGVVISVAWGQDPDVAAPGNPYLDFGTTVLPFPVPVIRKTSAIFTDNGTPGLSIGDVLEYTIELDNRGLLPLGNTVVIDVPPPSIAYVAGSTTLNNQPVADNPSGTAFPLDAPGYTIPIILRGGNSAFKYRTTVLASGSISNTVTAVGYNIAAVNVVAPPPTGGSTQCGLNFSDSLGTTLITYGAGDGLYVTLSDGDANTSSNSVQTLSVVVRNLSRGDLETLTLTETGNNTGVFRNTAALPSSLVTGVGQQDGTLNVAIGDLLNVSYTDAIYGDTCGANATIAVPVSTKVLYLSDPAQGLDRVDPVAAGDVTTAQTAILGGGVPSTINVDAASRGISTSNTLTIAHTTSAGSDRLMLVGVSYDRDGGTVSSVTYGGTPLTRIADIDNSSGSVKPRVDIWRLVAPASGAANVIVTFSGGSSTDGNAGVVTFTGVDQTTPTGTVATNISSGSGNTTATVNVTSAAGELVFDTMAVANAGAANAGPGQTRQWTTNTANIRGAGSTEAGAASVTMSWTNGSGRWAIAAVPIRPATAAANSTATFTQAPVFCTPFTLLSNRAITLTNFVAITSGSMPVNPAITAQLRHGTTNLLTLATPTYSAGPGTLVWSGTLPANVTVPAGAALNLLVSNAQAGVGYRLEYDSSTRPAKITLPTTNIIEVTGLGVYDAPFPGGSLVTTPVAGSTVYVRAAARDPFGSYDITSVGLVIDGPGVSGDLSVTLTNSSLVADDGCARTYEYAWTTGANVGAYDLAATANEGTEGINAVAATAVQLTFLDLGTPGVAVFTAGNNGAVTNQFATNAAVCVRVTDQDQNTNNAVIEVLTVSLTSSSGDVEPLTLTETATNSGVFTGCLAASTTLGGATNNGTLLAPAGSVLMANYTDPTDGSDTSSATATVVAPPGIPALAVSKTLVFPADAQAGLGEAVQFTIQVVNTGSIPLTNVTVTDTFPAANLTFTSATRVPDTTNSGALTWTGVGPLAPGASTNFTVNFTAAAVAAPAVNTATANGVLATNADTAGVTITRSALTLTKTLLSPAAGPVGIGSNLVFRIAITNTGTVAIPTLPLEDEFSAGCFTFVSATLAPDGVGAGSLFWADVTGGGSLAAGATLTIDVTMTVAGGCDPANNLARADFAVDQNGDPVPSATGSVGVTTLAGRITGAVYDDLDVSGTLTTNDVGLAGVTLQIFSDPNGDGDPLDGVLLREVTTLTNGTYELLNLSNGFYVIVESDPPGYASSAPVNNRIATNLTGLATLANVNFFDYLPAPTNYASIAGNVWDDANLSGTKDLLETGVTDVGIDLIQDLNTNGVPDLGEPVVDSALTGLNGGYTFVNVVPGAYVVRESDLFGWLSTADAQGANDNRIALLLAPGTNSTGNDFLDYFTGNSPTNDPPIAFSQSVTNAEDVAFAITLTGFDVDGPVTNFVVATGPANGGLSGTAPNLTYTPNTNFNGADNFTFRVNDGSLTSAVATVSITITPMNDAPVLALAIPDQAGVYGTNFSYTFPTNTFTDVDAGQTLTFTATNLPPGITFDAGTRTFSGTPTAAGTFTVTVTATDNGAPALGAGDTFDIVVSPAPLNITADNATRGFGQANPPFTFALTGFVLSDTTNVVSGAPALTTTATTNSPVGNYPINVALGTLAASNYTFAFIDGNLSVTGAVPVITWTPLGPITYGTPLGAPQLNATSSVAGAFNYAPTNGVVLNAGTNLLTAVFNPTDTNNFSPVNVSAPLTVLPALLSVTASNQSRVYNTANPTLTFSLTGFVNGDTASNAVSGAPGLSTPAILTSPVGGYPINVTAGTLSASNYTFALNDGTLTVTPGTPVITWTPVGPIIYGTPLDTNQLNATSTVPGTNTYSPTNGTILPVGTNTLTVVSVPGDTNYVTLTNTANLVVQPANLNVTALDAVRGFGQANPPFVFTLTGFIPGETNSVVSGAPDLSTPATLASPVGPYPINVGAGTLFASNYTFSFIPGTLSVTGAAPVITWSPFGPITYGTPLGAPQLNATSSVPGVFSYLPDTGVVLNTGSNLLTAVFTAGDTNFSPVNVSAPLLVLPSVLSVTASNQTRVYGDANPPLTFGLTGFVNGDSASNAVSGAPVLSTAAVTNSPVGAYPILLGGGTLAASNYLFALNDGTLTVTPASPAITWTPLGPIVYGTPYGTNQLNAGASVPGTFLYTPDLGTITNAGSNTLTTVFTPADTNFASITTAVPFLILKAPLTATADNQTSGVGAPLPPLTISYSGFVNGDTASVLDTPPTATTTATTNSPAGLYPITPAGGSDDNYTFSHVDGTLTLGTVAPSLQILRQIDGFTTFNPQTSLFEQTVLVSNSTTATFTALRLTVSGLPATVQLYNAHGTNGAGNPYVDLGGTLAPGGTVTVLLEYWSVNRQPFAPPTVSVQVLSFLPPSPPLPGTVTAIDRSFMAANGRFYLEWASQVGRTYYVQYGNSPSGPWTTVLSPVTGTGFRIVWIDDGPPKTETPGSGGRYYRLIVQ